MSSPKVTWPLPDSVTSPAIVSLVSVPVAASATVPLLSKIVSVANMPKASTAASASDIPPRLLAPSVTSNAAFAATARLLPLLVVSTPTESPVLVTVEVPFDVICATLPAPGCPEGAQLASSKLPSPPFQVNTLTASLLSKDKVEDTGLPARSAMVPPDWSMPVTFRSLVPSEPTVYLNTTEV